MGEIKNFEGWAKVVRQEQQGRSYLYGYVTVERYPDQLMLCLRATPVGPAWLTLEKPDKVNGEWLRPGSVIQVESPEVEVLFSADEIIAIKPLSAGDCHNAREWRTTVIFRAPSAYQGRSTHFPGKRL